MRIEVEESALDSIKAMALRLQEERDELLIALQNMVTNVNSVHHSYDRGLMNFRHTLGGAKQQADQFQRFIDRCNSSPKVME